MKNGILILDFGSQYNQLIARRVRDMGVYSEVIPFNTPLQEILDKKPAGIILSGGPTDHEANAHFIRSVGDNSPVNLAGSSLTVTAEVLRQATITISVNTGVMHLAAALGAPLVSLQGPTSTLRWGAVARPGRLVSLSSQRACAPCLHLGFEYACQDNSCMHDIRVAAVLDAVDSLFTKEPKAIQ